MIVKIIKGHLEKTKKGVKVVTKRTRREADEIMAIIKNNKKEIVISLLLPIPIPASGMAIAIIIIGGKYFKAKRTKKKRKIGS